VSYAERIYGIGLPPSVPPSLPHPEDREIYWRGTEGGRKERRGWSGIVMRSRGDISVIGGLIRDDSYDMTGQPFEFEGRFWNDVGAAETESLAGVLGQCRELVHLNLDGHEIGANGAKRLARVLGHRPALTHLNLSDSHGFPHVVRNF
jgi:hypothetical protein